jgi:integral membrane sensor domain MASE1
MSQEPYFEEFRVQGETVVAKIKELIHEGNVRRVIVKNDQGQTIMEIPLTFGLVGAVIAPALAALGALLVLASNYTIVVERTAPPTDTPNSDKS